MIFIIAQNGWVGPIVLYLEFYHVLHPTIIWFSNLSYHCRAWAEVVGFRVATLWCLCVPAFRSLNSIHKNNKESVAGAASMVCAKRENFDSPPSLDNLNHVICDYLNRELRGIDKILVLVFLVSKIHWSCLHVHF